MTTRSFRFHRIWLLAGLLLAGLVIVAPALAQGPGEGSLTVIAPALNVRSGPGIDHSPISVALAGDELAIVGQDAASGWWQVRLPDGSIGWVTNAPAYVAASSTPQPAANPVPDSSTIVFQTASGGPIYAIQPDGSGLRYLTTGLDPALSPDGQWVAFTRWEASQNGALGNLWVIKIDGSGERVIHNDVLQPRSPTWSLDGTQIAIGTQHGGRVQPERVCGDQPPPRDAYDIDVRRAGGKIIGFCYTLPPDPHWGLRLVDVASGRFEDLPNQSYSLSPAWDPANPWRLVYDGNRGLVNLDLTRTENVSWPLTGDFNDHSPAFSPDGSRIAVSYRQDDHWEIHVLNADGGNRARLTQTSYQTLVEQQLRGETPHSYNNAAPAWSPDGSQLAFLTDRTGQWEIWVMNADGSEQRPLFPPEKLAGLALAYNGVDERVLSWR